RKHARGNNTVIGKSLWEERTDRTIDETCLEDGFIGWASFSLNKTASFDFTGSVKLFFVVHQQREEITSIAGSSHRSRHQDDQIPQLQGDRPISLKGHMTGLED